MYWDQLLNIILLAIKMDLLCQKVILSACTSTKVFFCIYIPHHWFLWFHLPDISLHLKQGLCRRSTSQGVLSFAASLALQIRWDAMDVANLQDFWLTKVTMEIKSQLAEWVRQLWCAVCPATSNLRNGLVWGGRGVEAILCLNQISQKKGTKALICCISWFQAINLKMYMINSLAYYWVKQKWAFIF